MQGPWLSQKRICELSVSCLLMPLAFVSCLHLWGGNQRPPVPTPVHEWAVYAAASDTDYTGGALWVASLEDGRVRALGEKGFVPRWMPGEFKVGYREINFLGYASPTIGVLDTAGTFFGRHLVNGSLFAWRPDGRQILSDGAFVDIDSRRAFQMPFHAQMFLGDSIESIGPYDWAGDSTSLLVRGYGPAAGPPPWNYATAPRYDYFIAKTSTGALMSRLTHNHYAIHGPQPDRLAGPEFELSPDKSKLVSKFGHGLIVLDIPTQIVTQITTNDTDGRPRWGADSKSIYFLRGETPRTLQLYRTSLDSLGAARKMLNVNIALGCLDIMFK